MSQRCDRIPGIMNEKSKDNKGYHRLLIWQKARELVLLVYRITEEFPSSEEFGFKSQLRSCRISCTYYCGGIST